MSRPIPSLFLKQMINISLVTCKREATVKIPLSKAKITGQSDVPSQRGCKRVQAVGILPSGVMYKQTEARAQLNGYRQSPFRLSKQNDLRSLRLSARVRTLT